jgi:Cu-processing system permease protein
MGTAIALKLPIEQLFLLALANPLQVFKMASILDINATLDILGPAGIFATQEFGRRLRYVFLGVMVLWIVFPALLAYVRFASKSDL